MPTAPPAADLFSLKKSCKIEQEVVIFVGYSRHSGKEVICPWIHPVCCLFDMVFFVGYSISTVRERNTMYLELND